MSPRARVSAFVTSHAWAPWHRQYPEHLESELCYKQAVQEANELTKLTAEKRERFFSILADGGSVTAAAAGIGVSRAALYKARDLDPEFAAAWDDAVERGTDALEDEAVKRAKNSSDTILIFLLKGRRPEKFKDRVANEHNVKALTLEQLVLSSFRPNANDVRPP